MIIGRTVYSIAYSIDTLASSLTFGAPGETLSARFGKARNHGSLVGTFLANSLDRLLRSNHCATALANYTKRNEAAPYE